MSLASYHCSTPGSVSSPCLGGGRRTACTRGCCGRGGGCLPAAAVPLENPRRRELAQFVADHVFRHVQPHELPAVMDHKRLTNELRHDRAVPRPGLERLAADAAMLTLHFGEQALINVRALFQRSAHILVLPTLVLGVLIIYASHESRPGDSGLPE